MLNEIKNSRLQTGFQILAFNNFPEIKILIFILVLLTCLLSLLGNMTIIVIVCMVSRLHTPMYFFLCNLSVQDTVYVSTVQPKLLDISLSGNTGMLHEHCIIQIFFFILCIDTNIFLLTSMAYDRYVAICRPLRYSIIINKTMCLLLASSCWTVGALNSLMYSLMMSKVPFCKSRKINHYLCDLETMLQLSCKNTKNIQTLIFIEVLLIGFLPFVLILTSFVYIIFNILKIQSTVGRVKTFSSCSSHLIVVILFYGTCLCSYVKTGSESSSEQDKLVSMLYIILVPILNPLVYSLRNKEVLKVIKNIVGGEHQKLKHVGMPETCS
ncbi:olfactory receptor 5V1-like [Pelodytes ibericus]